MEKRAGTKFIKEFKGDEPVVAMVTFKDQLYIATCKGVYVMIQTASSKKVLKPLEIVEVVK